MKLRNAVWWLIFLPLGIALQRWVPGLDALVVGLIVLLRERAYRDLLWALPLLILIQEGMGSREFGGSVLWYGAVVVCFSLGRWLFEVENLLFILLLSTALGGVYVGLDYLMAPLQDLQLDMRDSLDMGLVQALYIPVAWRLAALTRNWVRSREETTP